MLPFAEGWLVTKLSVEVVLSVNTVDVEAVLVGHITSVLLTQPGVQMDATPLALEICGAAGGTDTDEDIVDDNIVDSCVVDGDGDDAGPPAWFDSADELIVFCLCTIALLR